jgi:hypothetical protein
MMRVYYRHLNIATIVDAFGPDTVIDNRKSFEVGVFIGADGEISTAVSA